MAGKCGPDGLRSLQSEDVNWTLKQNNFSTLEIDSFFQVKERKGALQTAGADLLPTFQVCIQPKQWPHSHAGQSGTWIQSVHTRPVVQRQTYIYPFFRSRDILCRVLDCRFEMWYVGGCGQIEVEFGMDPDARTPPWYGLGVHG